MPGNEVEDRVHNFFAQDNLSQGQHHSQVVDGNWLVPNNNLWVGNQRQIGLQTSNPKNYILQQSDIDRGHSSDALRVPHGLNYAQLAPRPEFARSFSQGQQLNLNGYMYGHVFQTRQEEASPLEVDTESDQHNLTSRGLAVFDLQHGSGPENHSKSLVRAGNSESPVSFDFFSGQQPAILQPLQQQSGFSDMQQLQQDVMFRKMQELQRQQQLQQLDSMQQNSINQVSSFAKHASGNHPSAVINGTPISEAANYSLATELTAGNANWMQRGSLAMQGSSNGILFSPDQGQASRMMSLVPQQLDQSLHGVPISGLRGSLKQYPHMAIDKSSMQQIQTFNNSLPGHHYTVLPDQINLQDGTLMSREGFQGKNMFGHAAVQSLNSGINMEDLQQVNSLQRTAPLQDLHGRQELTIPSKTSQEKPVMQVASSQDAVALDPTEEKFLFGSDDSIWDSFGRSANMSAGAHHLFNGTGFLNGFASVQSGTWSALMQSAVAETSGSDVGVQEEWSGFNFQHNELPTGNLQPSTYNDGRKQQPDVADDRMQIDSSLSSGSVPFPDDKNMNTNFQSVSGFQQLGHKFLCEQGEKQKMEPSQSSRQQQSLEGGSTWLNRGPPQKQLAERNPFYGNASHSLDAEKNIRSMSGSLTPQQSGACQPCDKPSSWNVIESISHADDAVLKVHELKNSSQHSHNNDQKRAMQKEIGHGGRMWRINSDPNTNIQLELIEPTVGSSQVNREGLSLNDAATVPNCSTTKAREEASQLLPNSHHLNYRRSVDSSVKSKGNEGMGKLQHQPVGPESSLNSSDKGQAKTRKMDKKKQNVNDSFTSNLSHYPSGGLDNVLLDASDSRSLPGGKQKSAGQFGRKTPGARKFQYHPMGNLDEDVEPSYSLCQASQSQGLSQQCSQGLKSHDQGYFGQSKYGSHVSRTSAEMGKGHVPDLQGDVKGFHESSSGEKFSGYLPNMSAPFGRSIGSYTLNKASQSSQNMLELLQKVDQSREPGTELHFSSLERNLSSERPEAENSDGSVGHLQRSQSSASQGFGLQLAPPLQRLPFPNHALPSQSSAQIANPFNLINTLGEMGEKSIQHETSQEEPKNNKASSPAQTDGEASHYKRPGNFSSAFNSNLPYSGSQLQSQRFVSSGQVTTSLFVNMPSDRPTSHPKQTDDSCNRDSTGHSAEVALPGAVGSVPSENFTLSGNVSQLANTNISVGEAVPISQPLTMSGIYQQGPYPMLPNMWTTASAPQHLLVTQARHAPSRFSQSHLVNVVESASPAPLKSEDQNAKNGGDDSLDAGACSTDSQSSARGEEQMTKESPCQQASPGSIGLAEKMNAHEKESTVKYLSDASPLNPAATQRDIEAFGRSLKPNNFFHQNYSLLNQMRFMKNVETDSSNRGFKRLRGPESGMGGPQVVSKAGQSNEQNTMVGDALACRTAVTSGDSKMSTVPGSADNLDRNAPSQFGNISSQDIVAFGRNDSQNQSSTCNMASVRVEPSQISPQMAPSWFDQFGTFKNGQLLPTYDARKAAAVKTMEQPVTPGKALSSFYTLNSMGETMAAIDANQVNIEQISTPASEGVEHFSSPQSLRPDIRDQHLIVARPKKRRSATSELLPWHKEVLQGSRSLQTIRMAEVEWTKAANRLHEKVEDEADMIEDIPSILRTKRRLILTTQLMQQLFCPPPAAILSADAGSNYERVAYVVARLVLGDACGLASCLGRDSLVPHDSTDISSGKCEASERIENQHLSKVMEGFIDRARNLENDFVSLDKRMLIADLRVEGQDLEKFSVINRFAKFHGRGQADGAETSLSSDSALNPQKPCPQRYVTALAMPRNLPERVECLSL